MDEIVHLRIRDINPHIVCSLCAGYFVDATTITECLHTFCKSCIVKYLQTSKLCPQCGVKIHETQPLINLRPDRTMQDIVFKLIPSLFENEDKRILSFYKLRGLVGPDDDSVPPQLTSVYDDPQGHYFRYDDQVAICLDRYSPTPQSGYTVPCLQRKFVRTSLRTCIFHVVTLLHKKLSIPTDFQVDLLCNGNVLESQICLKQVCLSEWYGKDTPLLLFYRVTPT